jgi:predicted MFS family arabinose efflux permease
VPRRQRRSITHLNPHNEREMTEPAPIDTCPPPPLAPATRARGRRLAITSHPAGMTFWTAYTEHLPTLLLVSLGASEFQIGLQGAFLPGLQALQLPTLRMIARVRKRTLLVIGQVVALVGGLPLLFLEPLLSFDQATVRIIVLASFAWVAAGLNIGSTVWFPMLRAYMESDKIGQFFGIIRSIWHVALIVYFLIALRWLSLHPGDFAPLFAGAWLLGVLRVVLVSRMPERSEQTEGKIRVREAVARVRNDPRIKRYLLGVTLGAAIRTATIPFTIVMLRREIGFSDSQILYTTLSYYAGALASLYLWGRITDRIGAAPVFRMTAIGMSALLLLLLGVDTNDSHDLALAMLFFAGFASLTAGFGVADTQVLFRLAPEDSPARTLVICGVTTHSLRALAPIVVGGILDQLLTGSGDRIGIYHGFFLAMAVLQLMAFLPLRGFTRDALRHGAEA